MVMVSFTIIHVFMVLPLLFNKKGMQLTACSSDMNIFISIACSPVSSLVDYHEHQRYFWKRSGACNYSL